MARFREYDKYDALGLAELVRKKKITPAELCDEAINRAEKVNPQINAIIHPMYDYARKTSQAKIPSGPFKGVPFLLKDLMASFAGVPLTSGSRAFRNYVPGFDSELVSRFKKAGTVIMGKTNCPELGLMAFTEPVLHGPTRNPWDLERTPGGSSGGAAAAVAAGIVPMASGGDGGGSIRIPSAYCGLFGLKPSRGRIPAGPEYGQVWQGAVVEHVLTRTVRDSAVMLDATQGPDRGAPYVIEPPEGPYRSEIRKNPGKLKIAFCTGSPIGTEVDPDCLNAVMETAKLLESLGHNVEEAEPAFNGIALAKSYMTLYFGEIAADIDNVEKLTGKKAGREDFEPVTWTLGLLGRTFTAGEFVSSLREWNLAGRAMGEFFSRYDLYLTPTTAALPARIGEHDPRPFEKLLMKTVNSMGLGRLLRASGIVDQLAVQSLERVPFTQLVNLTGLPAMSVPLYWTDTGLPLGSHFIGPFGSEGLLLRLAAQLEKAKPWFDRKAPVHA